MKRFFAALGLTLTLALPAQATTTYDSMTGSTLDTGGFPIISSAFRAAMEFTAQVSGFIDTVKLELGTNGTGPSSAQFAIFDPGTSGPGPQISDWVVTSASSVAPSFETQVLSGFGTTELIAGQTYFLLGQALGGTTTYWSRNSVATTTADNRWYEFNGAWLQDTRDSQLRAQITVAAAPVPLPAGAVLLLSACFAATYAARRRHAA